MTSLVVFVAPPLPSLGKCFMHHSERSFDARDRLVAYDTFGRQANGSAAFTNTTMTSRIILSSARAASIRKTLSTRRGALWGSLISSNDRSDDRF